MSDDITMGDEELDCKGIEVPGGELDPLCDLIAWTENVRALDRAVVAFPGLEAVVDDNGLGTVCAPQQPRLLLAPLRQPKKRKASLSLS